MMSHAFLLQMAYFLKDREKSGNFTLSLEKLKSLKEVREKWNLKSTHLFFPSTFIVSNI